MATTPPQEFLNPAIARELDKELEAIEEFFLDGDEKKSDQDEQPPQPPAAPTPAPVAPLPTATTYTRPLIESSAESVWAAAKAKNAATIGQQITSESVPKPKASPTQTYPSWNAVHMEVQSNAKLPTFNLSVNRSNSLGGLQIPAPRGRRSYGPRRRVKTADSTASSSAASSVSGNEAVDATTAKGASQPEVAPSSPIPKLRHNTLDPSLKLDNATSEAIDEILRLNENDMNLSEMFFDEDRSSAALAYSCHGGIPRSYDIPKIDSKNSLDDVASATNVEKIKNETKTMAPPGHRMPLQPKLYYTRQKPLPIPGLTPERNNAASRTGEANQTNVNSATTTNLTMAQAIATAAAIATTSDSSGGTMEKSTAAALSMQPTKVSQAGGVRSTTAPIPSPATAAAAGPSMNVVSAQNRQPAANLPHTAPQSIGQTTIIPPRSHPPQTQVQSAVPTTYLRAATAPQVSGKPPSGTQYNPSTHQPKQSVSRPITISHAAAHATTKASLAYAQSQRSSYGYGANHRVVGVPAPPPNSKGYPKQQHPVRLRTHPVTGAPYVPMYTTTTPTYKLKPTAASPAPASAKPKIDKEKKTAVDTEDPAYERKKQRAKDARVRLNESIEELGIAIELCGSQSRERLHNLSYAVPPPTDPAAVPPITPLQKVMIDTTAQAENAKKWDRPAFVGLAATLIHGLNAQCEGLMREVLQLRRERDIWRHHNARNSLETGNVSPDTSSYHYGPCPIGSSSAEVTEPLFKKQKLDEDGLSSISGKTIVCNDTSAEEQRIKVVKMVSSCPKILNAVAQFLDPPTLCTCLCVSKEWISLDIFQNQQTWLGLCYKRFGSWSVRKWEGDEDDEEEVSASHASPSMDLFCRMAESNVKPFCSLDGSIYLGGASLDRSVSGWVSLVERSNGETSRSVLLTKIVNGESHQYYSPIPVVELRILVQNIGYSDGAIHIPDQQFSVDASTRRKGEKLLEVTADERFKRQILHLEKTNKQELHNIAEKKSSLGPEMCQLNMFEYAVLSVHIHARGCSTTSKFCHRGKNIQILVSINGTTRPLVIPISGHS